MKLGTLGSREVMHRFSPPLLGIRYDYDRAAVFAAVTDPIGFRFEPLKIVMPNAVRSETLRTAII
jgi:hypothetical protein